MLEAERCLQCPRTVLHRRLPGPRQHPAVHRPACATATWPAAAESLLDDNALPCVTGRVCPQETQCEGVCLRGKKGKPVAIGYLERFVADWAQAPHRRARAHATARPDRTRPSRSSAPGRPA